MNKKTFLIGLTIKTFAVSLIGLSMTPADVIVKSISTAKADNCSAWKPGGDTTYYSCGGSAWNPGGGDSTYFSEGGSSWKPGGGDSTYYSGGGSSWNPGGGDSTYYSGGGSAWNPGGGGGTTYYSKPGKPGKPKPRGRG